VWQLFAQNLSSGKAERSLVQHLYRDGNPLDARVERRQEMSMAKVAGVVLVFIDERGHAIAHAGDFERQAPGGFTLHEGQRHRAKRALAHAVCNAYASPMLVRGMDSCDCERIMERLCRVHGCKVHEVSVGHVGGAVAD
jgi:hypothetical protein